MLLRFFLVWERSQDALVRHANHGSPVEPLKATYRFGDEENNLELELTPDGEVFDRKVLFSVVGQVHVEG